MGTKGTPETVLNYIKNQYGIEPDFLWAKYPNNAAFRHKESKKWFAAMLWETPKCKLGLGNEGVVDILDLKCDPNLQGSLLDGHHFLPGYHMNKEHWITVVLDGSVSMADIYPLIDMSFASTAPKKSGARRTRI